MAWDIYLFRFVNNWAGRFGSLDALGIFAAVFLLPLLGVLLLLAAFTVKSLREEHWYEMPIKALLAGALAYGVRSILGELLARPRPFFALSDMQLLVGRETSHAFPSGHAAVSFALAFVVYRQDRDWGMAFLVLAVLVALGRVFVGVHYPLDILGGAVVGWGAAWIVNKFEHAHWSKFKRSLRV